MEDRRGGGGWGTGLRAFLQTLATHGCVCAIGGDRRTDVQGPEGGVSGWGRECSGGGSGGVGEGMEEEDVRHGRKSRAFTAGVRNTMTMNECKEDRLRTNMTWRFDVED